MRTFNWPPARTTAWPYTGTSSWPRRLIWDTGPWNGGNVPSSLRGLRISWCVIGSGHVELGSQQLCPLRLLHRRHASEDWHHQKLLASQIHPIDRRSKPAARKTRTDMFNQLSGATRLFPDHRRPDQVRRVPGAAHPHLRGPRPQRHLHPDAGAGGRPRRSSMAGLTATPNVDGILVTMPHKHTAFAYCATSSERATLLGVVSVIRRNTDGTWHGDMLDGLAFVKAQTGPRRPA